MRNKSIDVYKFIFCLVIALLHFYKGSGAHLIGGGIAVEFYVMSAAWFFYRKLEKQFPSRGQCAQDKDYMDNVAYVKQRFLRFFPYTTAVLLIGFFEKRVWKVWLAGNIPTLGGIYRSFSRDIWDYLLFSLSGINDGSGMLNGPLWTISSMLICEFIIWGLYQHNKKVFRTLIAPVSVMVVLSYWKNIEGTADNLMWIGFTTFGTLRVFGCYSLTLFIYENAKNLQKVGNKINHKGKVLLTFCEFSCLLLAIANMEYSNSRYFRYVNILLFFIALSIAFSGQSYNDKVFSNGKISKYLGELSMAVYLIHAPVLEVFRVIYPDPSMLDAHVLWYLLIVLILSVIFNAVMKWVNTITSALYAKLKMEFFVS